MNDQQKEWHRQFWNNFGATEYFRFGCVVTLWALLGIGLEEFFHSVWILFIVIVPLFIFGTLSLIWKPIYIIFRKILGNPNLPTEPLPRSITKTSIKQPLPWWIYLWTLLRWAVLLLLLYTVIKYILK